jgi:hypothetical protein
MNVRPHPSLLPQEKEKRSSNLDDADVPGFRAFFSAREDETALIQGASKLSSDAQNYSLSPGERVRVRASVKTIFSSALFFLIAFISPLRAQDTITNVMSSVVSYQYYDALGTDTNSAIVSPIVSYQYFDSLDASSVNFLSSPVVSYYYQFLDAPLLTIVPTNRVPTSLELSSFFILPSQLEVFQNGAYASIGAFVDTNAITIVLTHGWIPTLNVAGIEVTQFGVRGVDGWPTDYANQLRTNGVTANIVTWNWDDDSKSAIDKPGDAAERTPDQGTKLGKALLNVLGPNYSRPIHFIGHSLGTLVNAYAANYLQGTNFAPKDEVSPTPWPATNMQMTLFDEAEAARGITSFGADIDTISGQNGNPLLPKKSYDNPLPRQFAWADNYIAAVGLLQTNAANVILTNGFPANASNPISWFINFADFHAYPYSWYEETIETDVSAMGFLWSFERGGWFSQAPSGGSVYVQAFSNSQWNLTVTNWTYGTNLLNARFQEYRNGLAYSLTHKTPSQLAINGLGSAEYVADPFPAVEGLYDSFIMTLLTTPANTSPKSQIKMRPFGSPSPAGSGSSINIPAYAWMLLVVPVNAVSLSFDYNIQGDWQSDSLAAAFDGTNVLLITGNTIQTNVTFTSGSIDISAFAGQTNEFFIGIVGGTSTNAQLTVENLAFSISSPPSLQAQFGDGNLMLSWPLSAQSFNLQTTTNLADPNSWTTITNVPAIVNLQNTITNPIVGSQGFYRLIQQQ